MKNIIASFLMLALIVSLQAPAFAGYHHATQITNVSNVNQVVSSEDPDVFMYGAKMESVLWDSDNDLLSQGRIDTAYRRSSDGDRHEWEVLAVVQNHPLDALNKLFHRS